MDQFHKAVNVWLVKPQVSHSKIFASKIIIGSFTDKKYTRKIIFKDYSIEPLIENIEIDHYFVKISSDLGLYEIQFNEGQISILQENLKKHSIINEEFLKISLTFKLNRWFHQEISSKTCSLSQIDIEFYQHCYNNLKEKYGKELVKNWEEKTDPEKFVYEDIAIASYLISLWKDESKNDIKFIDVGCGNGLLVYLLIMEGFSGIGVDLRSRHIWNKYPENVQQCLQVGTVDPNSRYPGYNWWIGNHSDELTPWIPIIAAKSTLSRSNVFLLPCCPFDLFGKFSKSSNCSGEPTNRSRYNAYQNFIEKLMEKCGLNVKTDYLRIPSTKRFSLIGYSVCNNDEDFKNFILPQLEEYIISREGICEFKPREIEIPNKNCSTIDHSIRDLICDTVFSNLLTDENFITTSSGIKWNKGGRISLNDLSSSFSKEILQKLKTENGGLQTLLKNHHQAFKVIGGFVEIRYEDSSIEIIRKRKRSDSVIKLKSKSCWLFSNHPDGCPYTTDKCNFIHVMEKK